MKSVLISVRPKWCELIASGKKTVEVRKTKPKLEPPFKCYIYCTKTAYKSKSFKNDVLVPIKAGKVIGEFICDFINEYTAEFVDDDCYEEIRQVWDNEDYLYEVEKEYVTITTNEDEEPDNCFLCNASCLSFEDIKKYIGINFHEKPFYGWHISNLIIYDETKELSDFYTKEDCMSYPGLPFCEKCKHLKWQRVNADEFDYECSTNNKLPLKRPPQSWCYVEELKE